MESNFSCSAPTSLPRILLISMRLNSFITTDSHLMWQGVRTDKSKNLWRTAWSSSLRSVWLSHSRLQTTETYLPQTWVDSVATLPNSRKVKNRVLLVSHPRASPWIATIRTHFLNSLIKTRKTVFSWMGLRYSSSSRTKHWLSFSSRCAVYAPWL